MNKDTSKLSTFPYWINNVYSLGYWLKDYGYYPKSLPLFTYMDHGVTLFDTIPPHEINNDAPLIFKFSPRLVKIYKQQSKKPVYNVLNPAIHYRITNKIEKSPDAKGSLFFVAHTTPLIDDLTDWEPFVEDIKNLPAIYHPVDICLHPTDIEKGLGEFFVEKGFKVFCANDAYSINFIASFYSILKRYKYALSNIIGSYTFYAVEMGIPFSLYGQEPILINKGDTNIEMGAYESYKAAETYQRAKTLFSGLHTTISKEQDSFVNTELGKYTTISRSKAAFLLYKAYLLYSLKYPTNFKHLIGLFKSLFNKKTFSENSASKSSYYPVGRVQRAGDLVKILSDKQQG